MAISARFVRTGTVPRFMVSWHLILPGLEPLSGLLQELPPAVAGKVNGGCSGAVALLVAGPVKGEAIALPWLQPHGLSKGPVDPLSLWNPHFGAGLSRPDTAGLVIDSLPVFKAPGGQGRCGRCGQSGATVDAAYLIALHYYVKMTDDKEILTEPWVKRGVSRVMSILRTKKHRQVDLYETFLYPSDDPAEHPYVTYDNVVAWRALQIAARLYTAWGDEEMRAWAAEQAEALAKAIRNHCIVEGPLGPMYAWCVDPDTGECTIYDEPPGSLRMLHYYGFCRLDDPIYQNTVRWIFSEHNPHYYPEARFNEVGCPHTDEPFVMGLFNGLLNGGVDQALEILRTAELDAGLACEGFDRQTGIVKTGAGFATCSGFLAYAMWYALVRKPA